MLRTSNTYMWNRRQVRHSISCTLDFKRNLHPPLRDGATNESVRNTDRFQRHQTTPDIIPPRKQRLAMVFELDYHGITPYICVNSVNGQPARKCSLRGNCWKLA